MPHHESSLFQMLAQSQLGLQLFRYTSCQFFPERRLPEYALVCCFSGKIDVWENKCLTTVGPGEILVANPAVVRGSRYLPDGNVCEGATAIIAPGLMKALLSELRLVSQEGTAILTGKISDEYLTADFRHAAVRLRERRPGIDSFLDGCLRHLLVETLWHWRREDIIVRPDRELRLLSRQHFVHAVEYMNRCAKWQFAVSDLCEEIGISLAHFRRLLHASAERSPLELYNEVLIRRAEDLLLSERGAKQVAFELGFNSQSQFCRLFRHVNGLTPSAYQDRTLEALSGRESRTAIRAHAKLKRLRDEEPFPFGVR